MPGQEKQHTDIEKRKRAERWKRYYEKNKERLNKTYRREYYKKNKNKLNKYRMKFADPTSAERAKECHKKQGEILTDAYIKHAYKLRDTSTEELETKRNEILINRIKKQIKQKENEL